ncbi:MAG: response regulator transcription factor [Candidatus Kapabacteria bacterium]|nr:response regulator transcription factor [Ignavibacteriota bacterium]MCW5885859.1 response regulator transcription factor [Candidatus Kapabacteria bacterium]
MIFNEQNPVSLVFADDHEVVRAGIRRMLSLDKTFKIMDEANNGRDALDLILYHKPDIALLDIMMPQMSGVEVTRELKERNSETFVVILTAFEDGAHLEKALSAGADGYLTKDIPSKELIAALHTVVTGERVFSKSIVLLAQNKFMTRGSQVEPHIKITKREQEILNLIATGKSSVEIAETLYLSVRTVESHRYNVMQKLGIKNTAGLIRFAVLNSDTFNQ